MHLYLSVEHVFAVWPAAGCKFLCLSFISSRLLNIFLTPLIAIVSVLVFGSGVVHNLCLFLIQLLAGTAPLPLPHEIQIMFWLN